LTEPHAPTVCLQLEAIAREALAQPEQEPEVDLRTRWPMNGWKENKSTPPQRTEQCLGFDVVIDPSMPANTMKFVEPPQRKPLTHKEIWNAIRPLTQSDAVCMSLVQISMDEYRAIEAAHGIKENT